MTGFLDLEGAVRALVSGELVGFPTETVYGLGADATNPAALRLLYDVKRRPTDHPVIVHLSRTEALDEWGVDVSEAAHRLTQRWWPGPLTVVVAAGPRVSRVATGGLETVGLRVPNHPLALAMLDTFGGGVAAPSANRFGRVSPTTPESVIRELDGEIAGVLDGGPCAVGIESTIVDCGSDPVRVLRPGAITVEMISELLGERVAIGGATRAPGTLAAHYAPKARVEIAAGEDIPDRVRSVVETGLRVGVINWSQQSPNHPRGETDPNAVTLATVGSADEYAYILYSALRQADDLGVDVVLAIRPGDDGVGRAVLDRLRRAAGGR